jgi:hypothetical protein
MIYLACPYSHEKSSIRQIRFEQATKAAAAIMLKEEVVYSPITHGHAIAEIVRPLLDGFSHAQWMAQCMPFLEASNRCYVLNLYGFQASKGVQIEVEWALKNRVPVSLINVFGDIIEQINTPWFLEVA